jgi:pimeloyl-ACP methyl ester carboxylesterase
MVQFGDRRVMRRLIVAILSLATLGGAAVKAAAPPQIEGSLQNVACPFDVSKALLPVECGRLKVPENYDDPGRTIEIAYMIVRAKSNKDPGDPVLVLSGGPGSPSLVYAEMLVANPHINDVVLDRDWVFFDQRGQGRSVPALRCAREEDYLKRVRLCRDSLMSEGVDLSQYNSERSGQDIEALRKALGVKRWNLWGISYGSRLAFAVARDFPARVRSIVHDGPSDPGAPEIINDFRATDIAIERLLSKCTADEACAKRYPDLRTRFLAALPKLRRQPLTAGDQKIDDNRLITYIRVYLFNNAAAAVYEQAVQNLLAYMDAAARGDGKSMRRIEQRLRGEPRDAPPVATEAGYALGQNLSIECNEERSFENPEQYREAAAQSDIVRALFGASEGVDFFQDCALWPAGRADPVRKSRVHYDGPQLAFSGEFDPSLSGLSGYTIEMLYPNARNVVFRNAGHVQVDFANFPPAVVDGARKCALELARQFFGDPERRLDASCAEARTFRFAP